MNAGKYSSVQSVKEMVSFLIEKNDINQALHLVHDLVERIVTEPLCTSQVFGSKVLDDLCQRIGACSLARISAGVPATATIPQEPVVYIVTRLQKSGGHTRVIEDFIMARPETRHIILSTELAGRSDTDYVAQVLQKKGLVVFDQAPQTSYEHRLAWLQKRLLDMGPQKVYLFNHHQDSVAVAAIQPEMKLDASFYHHGDHHLCLGVYVACLEHIDPHPMGYHHCREELGIANTYIPLTVEDKGDRAPDQPYLHDGLLTTCTAARSNKIEIPYFVSYLELVPQLLKATGGRHIHIGRLTPWALFRIRRGLKRCGIAPERFVYTPWVPSVWKALQQYRVDLYVASFPYGGGLTLIEAMGAGIPVALHRHVFSRVLSGIDLAYPGAFNWRAPEDLLKYCVSLSAETLKEAGLSGRMQYEKFHSSKNLPRMLMESARDRQTPNALKPFSVQSDEWALWMERQLTVSRVFSRGVYRALRRLRAWW